MLVEPNSSLKKLIMGYRLSRIDIGVISTMQVKKRMTTRIFDLIA